jgi:hypothetical protein
MEKGKYKIQPNKWDDTYFYADLHELCNEVGYCYQWYITTHLVIPKGKYNSEDIIFDHHAKHYPNEVRILNK